MNAYELELQKSEATRWLDIAEIEACKLLDAWQHREQVVVERNEGIVILISAFLQCAVAVGQGIDCIREACQLGEMIRVAAINRYGESFSFYNRLLTNFRHNNFTDVCSKLAGSRQEKIAFAYTVLCSVWAAHALGGNPDVCQRYDPDDSPLILFAMSMKDHFGSLTTALRQAVTSIGFQRWCDGSAWGQFLLKKIKQGG